MALSSSISNVHPILDTNKYYGRLPSFHTAFPNAAAALDAVANSWWEEFPFELWEALQVDRESVKERSIQEPEVTSMHHEGSKRMLDKLQQLWWGASEDDAYKEVIHLTFKRWTTSAPPDQQFLETAVDLYTDFKKRPMKDMKEWLENLETSGIDSRRYFTWVDEQYKLLVHEWNKGFEDITLEKALNSLQTANWKDSNDESAIVNCYLLHSNISLQPDIYLGSLGNSHLAVRVNCECVRPPVASNQTADALEVDTINSNILLGMRYKIPKSGKLVDLLFIPIGNVFRTESSGDKMNASIFGQGYWRDTGICLMLRIMKKQGTPGHFYMVRDLRPVDPFVVGTDATTWKNLGTEPFTLAKVQANPKQLPFQDILNPGLAEKPALKLKTLSDSEVEFVQTGMTGDWRDGHPPVGLYQDLDSD